MKIKEESEHYRYQVAYHSTSLVSRLEVSEPARLLATRESLWPLANHLINPWPSGLAPSLPVLTLSFVSRSYLYYSRLDFG
jgi:hypothetical protein